MLHLQQSYRIVGHEPLLYTVLVICIQYNWYTDGVQKLNSCPKICSRYFPSRGSSRGQTYWYC